MVVSLSESVRLLQTVRCLRQGLAVHGLPAKGLRHEHAEALRSWGVSLSFACAGADTEKMYYSFASPS